MEPAAAGRPAAHSRNLLDFAAIGGALDGHDHIHRFGDEFGVGGNASLLDELADADERRAGVIRMHRADAAGVTGVPGFEQSQGAAVAHFADDDAVWPQAHGGAQQPGHVGVIAGAQKHDVLGIDLQLAGVFDDDDAVLTIEPGHGIEDGVGKGRFSGAGAAAHQQVVPGGHGLLDGLLLRRGHDALVHVVGQGEDQCRLLAQGEAGALDERGDEGFEAAAVQRQLTFEDGLLRRHHGIEHGRHRVHDGQRPHGVDTAGLLHALSQSIHPERAVGVEHDFDDLGIFERGEDVRAHGPAQGFGLAGVGELLRAHSCSSAPG